MKYSFLIILAWTVSPALAQDYVVLNSGDTLQGEIKRTDWDYKMYEQVVFRNDGREVYKADDLKAYKVGEEIYETHDVSEKKKPFVVFLTPVVEGRCSLYKHIFVTTTYTGTGSPTMSPEQTTYYLHREGEKFHEYWFAVLKNGRDLYFVDDSQLTFDLRHGKYKKNDMKEIVEQYNRDKANQ